MRTSTELGIPDIFVAITRNPNWLYIQRELSESQTANSSPYIVSRVFRMNMKQMMTEVIANAIFGTGVAHVRVVEFQKRGLPHANCICFRQNQTKKKW